MALPLIGSSGDRIIGSSEDYDAQDVDASFCIAAF
jgi:hypothetical protein